MSSLSVRFLAPSLPNSRNSRTRVLSATAPQAVVPPWAEAGFNDSRLEPRVEERDGYWVLKEKFRGGINPSEKVKIEKEPMKLFMENGVEELANMSLEEIEKSKLTKDDIDIRLKWLGLFHKRKHQSTKWRNNERTDSVPSQCNKAIRKGRMRRRDYEAKLANSWRGSCRSWLDSLQSGMDNVRNPVGNSLAGIDPHEIVDTRPYTDSLSQYITANLQGNPAITNLPRKWNVCVVGSHDLYEHPHINDLAYMPATKNGRFGFNLLVGGFFSPKRCAEAVPLDAWVPADDLIPVCKAMLEAYRDLGARGNRQKTRMMWLIDELVRGSEENASTRTRKSIFPRLGSKAMGEERLPWCTPTETGGLQLCGPSRTRGPGSSRDMDELARLADKYGSGELRLTVEQNIIIPNVEDSNIESLLREPLLKEKFQPVPPFLMKGLVACTGNQFCGQAIIETKAQAVKVTEEVGRRVSVTRAVRMHWTGCPNSCGQIVEGVDVFLGGRIGSDSHLGDVYKKGVPCDDELVNVVVDILVNYFGAVTREREEEEEL
ncbi:hypothetical protein C3L33_20918, partial [Rhododendron williamsianum]